MARTTESARSPRKQIAFLDILTAIILLAAVALFVRPGSALYEGVKSSLASHATERATGRHWTSLSALATRLYQGDEAPELIEVSDYECPYCRAADSVVQAAVRSGVRIAVIHFPLPIHPRARPAAIAALCASEAGHFRDENAFLMGTSAWQADTTTPIPEKFKREGWFAKMSECIESDDGQNQLERQLTLVDSLGIRGTPTFLTRGKVLTEAPTATNLALLAKGK